MNSPTRTDRDNHVEAREGAWSSLESAICALLYRVVCNMSDGATVVQCIKQIQIIDTNR